MSSRTYSLHSPGPQKSSPDARRDCGSQEAFDTWLSSYRRHLDQMIEESREVINGGEATGTQVRTKMDGFAFSAAVNMPQGSN